VEGRNETNLASLPLDFPPFFLAYSLPAQSATLDTDIMATYFETVQKVRLPSLSSLHDTIPLTFKPLLTLLDHVGIMSSHSRMYQ